VGAAWLAVREVSHRDGTGAAELHARMMPD
jgi:hypothetical protein